MLARFWAKIYHLKFEKRFFEFLIHSQLKNNSFMLKNSDKLSELIAI